MVVIQINTGSNEEKEGTVVRKVTKVTQQEAESLYQEFLESDVETAVNCIFNPKKVEL